MITLLTPSKTMDFTTPAPNYARTERVLFPDEASQIRAELSAYSIDEIAQLMKVIPSDYTFSKKCRVCAATSFNC